MPANEHKQLVVIDFEYANANTPGLEFANHFTEWCYNYHSPDASYACNAAAYPTPDEQKRFIKAYVQHVPGYNIKSPESRPTLGSSSSISNFMLDSRAPPASSYDNEEKAREEKMHKEVERLTQEARLWRVANSAMWVAWGIVQAKVPGMDEALKAQRKSKRKLAERLVAKLIHPRHGQSGEVYHQQEDGTKDVAADGTSASTDRDQDTSTKASEIDAEIALEALKLEESVDAAEEELHVPHEHEIDDEADFDYLAYAQERAMFFWGDLLELDLIKEDELPEMVRQHAKRVSY
jgi:choline kinase